ncbi:MAG: radical SAM protein [Prolixibacteraceae bacterium]|nr:radical SAM protein [Prolixibacteraceae bacterium]
MIKPWEIFDSRIRSAMIAKRNLPFSKITNEKKTDLLNNLFQHETTNAARLIYIHIPFCNNVCPFCIYHKQKIGDKKIIAAYCSVVIKQIQALADTAWVNSAPFKAVYFGGGTPTSIPVEYLEAILNELKKSYRLTNDCEITVESTITDIKPAMVSRLKNAGVNRISLGVQSFNTAVRASLGRTATRQEISKTMAVIREEGISNICIDLMYNLKYQDFGIWQNDLSFLKTGPITGCSVYPLISASNRANPDKIEEKNAIETEYIYFIEADNCLVENSGWERFTSVQYGHREKGKAVYVTAQGQNADLLAFGSGAGGRIRNISYIQTGNIEEFNNNPGNFMSDSIMFLTIHDSFLKLRNIFGLSESLYLNKIDYNPIKKYFDDILFDLINKGLVVSNTDSFNLTQTGRFWAANISALFAEKIRDLIPQIADGNNA